jgi:predicted nucleic acid-binding protein
MRRVVSNTGPILHLTEAGSLDLMRHLGMIFIPPMVDMELKESVSNWSEMRPPWISVEELQPSFLTDALAWEQAGVLHPGEAEAVALARQVRAHWFLTDDSIARLLAQTLGLEVHGSLGIVLWTAAMGYLQRPHAELALDRLAASSLWISTRVFQEAKSALDHLFS